MHRERSQLFKLILACEICFSILVMIFLWHIFTPNDNDTFTYTKSDLGTLGDLVGGIINPVLTFATIVLLLWSIRIQGKELAAATEQSERSADALEQTQQIHSQNIEEQKYIAMIPVLTAKLDAETSLLYKIFREEQIINYKASGKGNAVESQVPKSVSAKIPSLFVLNIKATGKNKLDSLTGFSKDESSQKAKSKVFDKVNHAYHIIREIVYICEKFQQMGRDEILYRDAIHQARMINNSLDLITRSLGASSNTDSRYSVLSERINRITKNPPTSAIINEDGRSKPFTIVF